ncbi:MAG: T9SS type B sorting domain-containing protein [bacterium]|nr:T9SS type B sorting domain-containing protein [bacterium]
MKHKLLLLLLLIIVPLFAQNKNQSIGFKENKGQIIDQKGKPNTAVKYLLNSKGLNVQLKKNGFSYDIYETKKHPIKHPKEERLSSSPLENNKDKTPEYTLEYVFHRIDIDFVNANPNIELVTAEESKDYDNYYNVPNKPEGIINVHQYKQITYKNIYPNIDVVFSVPKDTLKTVEYNFVVHPKGKISDIQLKFNGAKTDLVDNKIRMNVRFGEMEETLPASWTEDGMSKKEITVGYTKIKKNVYGFETANPISNETVIIDPVPVRLWGTFYGDEMNINNLSFTDIGTDSFGNIYFTGYTASPSSSYATSGTHQTSIGNPSTIMYDGIIAKFSSSGNRLWGTFYGGESWDKINGLKVDTQNNIIITGVTSSKTNISSNGSYKSNFSGNEDDVFLAKFTPSGTRIWSTYFGGNEGDGASDIDIDSNNNIYIVGYTRSYSGISINNNFQTLLNQDGNQFHSSFDGFLSKFNSNGDIIWSTYIGGENSDYLETIKIASDHIVLGGKTFSLNYISTPGTFQENNYKNTVNGSVYKFTLDGNRVWSTYYGSGDNIKAIEIDTENNIYIGGETWGTDNDDNIASSGSFDDFNQWTETGFLAKLDPNGKRIWGTYIGTGAKIYSIIFKNNFIYIGGMGGIDTTITTSCAYKKNGFAEGYIGKFSKTGNLVLGTYVGGFDQYSENKICFENNNIIIGGTASQNNGIADSNSYQPTILGSRNFYLIKFSEENNCNINVNPVSNSPICLGNKLTFNVDSGYNYSWTGPNGFTSNLQNPSINNVTIVNQGTYNLIVSDNCSCQKNYDINVIVGDIEPPIPNLTILPTINGDCHTIITIIPTATDVCTGAITATTSSPLSYSLPGTYTVIWKYNDGNGNTSTQNQTITINNQPLPTVTSPQTFCIEQNAKLNNITITGQNIKWYDALTNGTLLSNTTSLQNGITYYASQTINGCESDRIPVSINIINTPSPTGNATQTFCSSQNPNLDTIEISGNEIKWYTSAGALLSNSTPLQDGSTYYASQTVSGCESTTKLTVTVSLISTLPANNYAELFCDDLNDGSEKVNLSDYNSKLISNASTYNFSYYSTFSGAENQFTANQIVNFSNYNLVLGDNKIYVRINSNNPCNAIVELKLTLLSKPIIPIPDVVPICENNIITIDAGSGYDTYLWSNGATTASIQVANPGDFSVTVTNNYSTISCSSTKNFKVKKSTIATITSIDTQDWTDNQNMITVYTSGTGDFEYSIDGIHFQDSNQFSNIISGQYTVSVRDKNGCGTVTDEVYLFMYPKFFTPNGDGYNDTWKIKFSDFEAGVTIKIFDRYGKFITELQNNIGWNGTVNSHELPATDYWFVVTRANGKEYRGHFSLKR